MKKEIKISWNSLSESRGPLKTGNYELETSALNGFALDYFLAELRDFPFIQINYLSPDFRIAEVRVKTLEQDNDTQLWQPSIDKELAKRLLVELPNQIKLSDEHDIIEQLRAIVLTKYGKTVHIPYPVYANS